MIMYTAEENSLICSFMGKLDTPTCSRWEQDLYQKMKRYNLPVTFDLKGINYVSSLFLRICLKVYKEMGPDRFTMINVSPEVKKVFKIAGFDQELNIT